MRRLEELLSDIPPGEREEALQYYNDYINDSGKENEVDVLASLGSPEQVAVTIKEGLKGAGGEFTEKGFRANADLGANEIAKYRQQDPPPEPEKKEPEKQGLSAGVIALIVVICIFASPVLLGIGSGLLGVIGAVVAVIISMIAVFGALSLTSLVVALVIMVTGIIELITWPLGGLAMIAASLVIGGIGVLFLLLTVLLAGKLIPAIIKGIANLIGRIFSGKGGKKQ
jgi:uncharacterized membrane protein